MEILLYALPGIDIPLAALVCFGIAAVLFWLVKAEWAGLAAAALGTALAFAGSADLVLLAALELLTLCVCLLASSRGGNKEAG